MGQTDDFLRQSRSVVCRARTAKDYGEPRSITIGRPLKVSGRARPKPSRWGRLAEISSRLACHGMGVPVVRAKIDEADLDGHIAAVVRVLVLNDTSFVPKL